MTADLKPVAAGETVRVELGSRGYDIVIGPNSLERLGTYVGALDKGARLAIVADASVAALHGETLRQAVKGKAEIATEITVPPGEASKCFNELERVSNALLDARVERGDLLIAFGGGVVGDLAGFAAAILRRGIRFVQVPTSLLAQVDSSVGGKTGIDTRHGKNLIGAFHQPALVIADTALLDSLSERHFRAGYAEVAKYGLIGDEGFYSWLEGNWRDVFAGGPARIHAIATSCRAKAATVAADEREHGQRALLNLGHTFGHAFEAATGYSDRLVHGEAIAIGMVMAFGFSAELGLCPADLEDRVAAHFQAVGLPTRPSHIPGGHNAGALPGPEGMLDLIRQDKKVERGALTFILAEGIGRAFVRKDVPDDAVLAFLSNRLRQ